MVAHPGSTQILVAANPGGLKRSKDMNEKSEKKLRLNKETIRNLSDESLEQVAGGQKKGDTGLICVSLVKFSACVGCSVIC
jgi:hypothetical protein